MNKKVISGLLIIAMIITAFAVIGGTQANAKKKKVPFTIDKLNFKKVEYYTKSKKLKVVYKINVNATSGEMQIWTGTAGSPEKLITQKSLKKKTYTKTIKLTKRQIKALDKKVVAIDEYANTRWSPNIKKIKK